MVRANLHKIELNGHKLLHEPKSQGKIRLSRIAFKHTAPPLLLPHHHYTYNQKKSTTKPPWSHPALIRRHHDDSIGRTSSRTRIRASRADLAPCIERYRLHMSDPKTVVASQRVSTSFRDTIVGSKKVQQALMFTAPVNPTTYGDPYRCNPVIEDFLILGNSWEPLRAPRTRTQNFVRVDALALDSVQSSTEQSWRRMYLSSEPYDVVVWQGFDDVETEFVYMRNVTFGRVYDRALELEEAKKVKDDGADEKREQWA